MEINIAALTTLCLGFSAGLLFVLAFIERPILPLMSSPDEIRDHEDDIRGIHAFLQAFTQHGGPNLFVPFVLLATMMSFWQAADRGYDVASLFVVVGLFTLLGTSILAISPASKDVHESDTYGEPIEEISTSLFRLVRLHHNAFLAMAPVIAAQVFILFG